MLLARYLHHCLTIDRELSFLFSSLGRGSTISFNLIVVLVVVAVAIGLVVSIDLCLLVFHLLLLSVSLELRRSHHFILARRLLHSRPRLLFLFPLCGEEGASGEGWTWRRRCSLRFLNGVRI